LATREEIYSRIIGLLEEKASKPSQCSFCGSNNWMVAKGYAFLPLTPNPKKPRISGAGFPFLPVMCRQCGNTHLINLLLLGVKDADLEGIAYPEDDGTK
jgi:hypothetical protein